MPKMNKSQFYETIRFQIITNELPPGEMLNEKDLMNRYGIGRSPLREVLVRLQQEGLIQTIPRLGSMVTRLEINEIREIVELRKLMEGVVGRLAADRIGDAQIDELKAVVAEGEKVAKDSAGRIKISTEFDTKFHNILYEAAQNRKLTEMLRTLQVTMIRLWHHMEFETSGFLNQIENLKMIVDALEKHDPRAARDAMEAHIEFVIHQVKKKIL